MECVAPPSSLFFKVDGDKVPKALGRETAPNPPAQSVLANIISSVEQTHFAGALQQRHSNMLRVHFNLIYSTYLVLWAVVSIYRQGVLLAAAALLLGPPGTFRLGPFSRRPGHTALGGPDSAKCAWHGVCGQQAGAAPILAGQGRPADVGSDKDIAQERSSHWRQDSLIALPSGTFSHSPGIAVAVRKGCFFLPLILWHFFHPGTKPGSVTRFVFQKKTLVLCLVFQLGCS